MLFDVIYFKVAGRLIRLCYTWDSDLLARIAGWTGRVTVRPVVQPSLLGSGGEIVAVIVEVE